MSLKMKKLIMAMFKAFSNKRNMWYVDAFLVALSYIMVEILVFSVRKIGEILPGVAWYIVVAVVLYIISLLACGSYKVMWQHAVYRDYIKSGFGCFVAGLIMMIISFSSSLSGFYVKSALLAFFITAVFINVYRCMIKLLHTLMKQYFSVKNAGNKKNILVIGAGSAGCIFVNYTRVDVRNQYNVVGFIDDSISKKGAGICGVKVLGNRNDIADVCEKYNVEEILIAIPSVVGDARKELVDICTETGCTVKIMPSPEDINEDTDIPEIRNVNIEDLLARDEIILDDDGISDIISGKTVMVTGGGGSIGSEICRQLMKYTPGRLIVLDIYENNAYDLQNELASDYPGHDVSVVIASVRDKERLDSIFEKFRPQVVFHAAAHKHVPLMEFSPGEAVKNNIYGTYNVAKCADEYGVEKFVMISTDKAVNPTNVMGATKRMCEMIVQAMQKVSQTQFVAVRFGNVLGSNGSVIPLFKKQIASGGPVTVTHKEITRFFMTIPEAAQLVIQASCFAQGGEIFVLDMGEPVKIYDLAKNLITLSGFVPDKDIKIEITGLRPGEKLYEELLMNEEGLVKTRHSKIYIGKPMEIDMEDVHEKLRKLDKALISKDNEEIRLALSDVVPTYTRDTGVCV